MQVPKWLYFAALWIFVAAQDIYDDNPNPDTQNYQFRYFVRDESTGDIKSQEETKQGGTVNGHYSVGEPTGDLRVVTYTADEGGFRADVKYEEGGSPASEDKARQTNAKSGVEFHWLPGNPDDIQEGKTGDNEDNSIEVSSELNQSSTESTTTNTSDQPSESTSEATTEGTSTIETNSESSTTEGLEIEIDIEKISKDNDSSSETSSTESSSESSNNISETPVSSIESTMSSTESAAENSLESTTSSSAEGKNTIETDEDNQTEDELSAEAAESAPLSEEVLPPLQPSQMYLPVISYQNLPFLNLPTLDNTPEKPPTIIYASQNFYNPWQWFGNSRRIARDVQHIRTVEKGFQHPVIPRHYR